jgi:hypothetical protein
MRAIIGTVVPMMSPVDAAGAPELPTRCDKCGRDLPVAKMPLQAPAPGTALAKMTCCVDFGV